MSSDKMMPKNLVVKRIHSENNLFLSTTEVNHLENNEWSGFQFIITIFECIY